MFKVNDVIVYAAHGVCQITDMEEKSVNGTKKKYFVLKPLKDASATIFVPMDNDIALKKMRSLLSKSQVHKLMDSMDGESAPWVENENERRELYRKILAGGDHLELIKMIKTLYIHKTEREAEGKRLHMSDERFFKDAEQILYNEFQYVLQLESKDDLMAYIIKRIESNNI